MTDFYAYGLASFLEGRARHSFTVELNISPDGAHSSTELYPTLTKNHKQLSYIEAQELLNNGEKSTEYAKQLHLAAQAAHILLSLIHI